MDLGPYVHNIKNAEAALGVREQVEKILCRKGCICLIYWFSCQASTRTGHMLLPVYRFCERKQHATCWNSAHRAILQLASENDKSNLVMQTFKLYLQKTPVLFISIYVLFVMGLNRSWYDHKEPFLAPEFLQLLTEKAFWSPFKYRTQSVHINMAMASYSTGIKDFFSKLIEISTGQILNMFSRAS